jgi:hypothetical protein
LNVRLAFLQMPSPGALVLFFSALAFAVVEVVLELSSLFF